MSKLSELPTPKRREIARLIALEAFKCIDPATADTTSSLGAQFFAALYETDLIREKEFHGSTFNDARCKLLEQFDTFHDASLDHAALYDECIAPVQKATPGFAINSSVLVRMWCTAHYTRMLCKDDGPFADLLVVDGNGLDDEDDSQEENDDNDSEEEEDEAHSSDDDIITTSSDEDDDDEDEGEDECEAPLPPPPPLGPARKKKKLCP